MSLFSGLRDKLSEGVAQFEASLTAPLPSSPSRTTAPVLPPPASPSPTSGHRASASASASGGTSTEAQSASQLADSALNSLRQSFRNRKSLDAQSRASSDSTRDKTPAPPVPQLPTQLAAPAPSPSPVPSPSPSPVPPPAPAPVVEEPTPTPTAAETPAPAAAKEAPTAPLDTPTSATPPDSLSLPPPDSAFTISSGVTTRAPTPAPPPELEPEPRSEDSPVIDDDDPWALDEQPEEEPLAEEEPPVVEEEPEPVPEVVMDEDVVPPVEPPQPTLLIEVAAEEPIVLPPSTPQPTAQSSEAEKESTPIESAPLVQPVVQEKEAEEKPVPIAAAPTPVVVPVADEPVALPVATPQPIAQTPKPRKKAVPIEVAPPAQPSVQKKEEEKPVSIVAPPVSDHILKEHAKLKQLKANLDRIVASVAPHLAGVDDVDAFEGELRNLSGKATMSTAEVARLTALLAQQTSRTDELRDTHRLESSSQSTTIAALQADLSTSSASLADLTTSYAKLQIIAKEEEEKRTKALSLLRALRQKLVKAEKDKEDLERDLAALRLVEAEAKAEKTRGEQEIVSMRAAQELQLQKMRQSFDREANAIKQQREREAVAKKGQHELDLITTKAVASKEAAAKDARIAQLEKTVRDLTDARAKTFDELQIKTALVESFSADQSTSSAAQEEVRIELAEALDRNAVLESELVSLRSNSSNSTRDDHNTRRLLVEAEARHEAKIRDLAARAQQLERDRAETEDEMARNLQDRLREVERMRGQIVQKDLDYAESVHSRQQREARIEELEKDRRELVTKLSGMEDVLTDLREDAAKYAKAEIAVREELNDRLQRASELEQRLEEVQTKESSLRSNNKILRDELRKLQSGVLQSEKQRHPGVGYFASYGNQPVPSGSAAPLSPGSDGSRTPITRNDSSSTLGSLSNGGNGSANGNGNGNGGGPGGAAAAPGDEALNFEYLRNVILQFLERPEMRPHLVSVLGVILHFTPAESRRLSAKAI